jgi:hypothetical protein
MPFAPEKKNTWRRAFYAFVPSWLYTGEGELVLHSLMRMADMWLERVRQGTMARFPTHAPETALGLLGESRLIRRGRSEQSENYRARLIAWRNPGHRVRGSAFALLLQVYHYWGGAFAQTITPKGNRHTCSEAAALTYEYGVPWNWDTSNDAVHWARFWVVLDGDSMLGGTVTAHPTLTPGSGLWGGTLGPVGRGYTIGQTSVTTADAQAMRNLVGGENPWRPLFARPEWVVVRLGGASFPTPDGTWHTHRGRYAASLAGLRFWPLRASV